jgi:hypothetical protein
LKDNTQCVSAAVNRNVDSQFRYAVSYWCDDDGWILIFDVDRIVLSRVDCCQYFYEKPLALAFHRNFLYATIYCRYRSEYAEESSLDDDSFDLENHDICVLGEESQYNLFKERCTHRTMRLNFFELNGDRTTLLHSVHLDTIGQPVELAITSDGTVLIQIGPNTDDNNKREIAFYPR